MKLLLSVCAFVGVTFLTLNSIPASENLSLERKSRLKVLTYNVWDVPPIVFRTHSLTLKEVHPSKERDFRLRKICDELKKSYHDKKQGWDVVVLQEVFSKKYRDLFSNKCGYPNTIDLDRHPAKEKIDLFQDALNIFTERGIGSGLMILSRYKISESSIKYFSVRGDRSTLFFEGEIGGVSEQVAKKGVLTAKIYLDSKLPEVTVATTHLVAPYDKFFFSKYREIQFLESLDHIKNKVSAEEKGHPIIYAGDFNFGPFYHPGSQYGDKHYSSYELYGDLYRENVFIGSRSLRLAKPNIDPDAECTSCGYQERDDFTGAPRGNPNAGDHKKQGRKVIDHHLYTGELEILSHKRAFTKFYEVPGKNKSIPLSDHYAVEAEYRIRGRN